MQLLSLLLNLAVLSAATDVRVCPAIAREMYDLYPVVNTYECMNQGAMDQQDRDDCQIKLVFNLNKAHFYSNLLLYKKNISLEKLLLKILLFFRQLDQT